MTFMVSSRPSSQVAVNGMLTNLQVHGMGIIREFRLYTQFTTLDLTSFAQLYAGRGSAAHQPHGNQTVIRSPLAQRYPAFENSHGPRLLRSFIHPGRSFLQQTRMSILWRCKSRAMHPNVGYLVKFRDPASHQKQRSHTDPRLDSRH